MTIDGPSGAIFSEDKAYRHLLWRIWDESLPLLLMAMLNPSVAGAKASESDPTVTRQIERARRLGCGGLLVVNTHDLVSTDPRGLKTHPKPVSDVCDRYILDAATGVIASGGFVVCAWGKHCPPARSAAIMELLAGFPLYCLGRNGDGSPEHPLYKKYDLPLLEFRAA